MEGQSWYSVRTLHKLHGPVAGAQPFAYQERILLFRGESEGDVRDKAIAEAERYAASSGNAEFLGLLDIQPLDEAEIEDGAEAYSKLKPSVQSPAEFIKTNYPDTLLANKG